MPVEDSEGSIDMVAVWVDCRVGARNTLVVAGGVAVRLADDFIDSKLPFMNFCKNI